MNRDLLIFLCCIIAYIFMILLPIFIYIKKKKTKNVLKYLKLKGNWRQGVVAGLIISIIYIVILIIRGKNNNSFDLTLNIGIRWLYGLTVGFLEEIPLRGFFLRTFEDRFSFGIANIIVTLLFVSLHFPIWIISGSNLINNSIRIFIVSLAFGYLVKEYDSLWPPIICHSVFNLSMWTGLV